MPSNEEPNIHAIASDVRHLTEDVRKVSHRLEEMSVQDDKRWEIQFQILNELTANKKEIGFLVRRVASLEETTESLSAWRWRTLGVIGVLVIIAEVLMKM